MSRLSKHIRIFLLVACLVSINCIPRSHGIKQDKNPVELRERLLALIEEHEFLNSLWLSGTGWGEATYLARNEMENESNEAIINQLELRPYCVHCAAKEILREHGEAARPAINEAYTNGNARIKFELLEFVDPDASDEIRYCLLDEIIHNDDLEVFLADYYFMGQSKEAYFIINRSRREKELFTEVSNDSIVLPFDKKHFFLRLLESDYEPERLVAIRGLSIFTYQADEMIPILTGILNQDNDVYCSEASSSLSKMAKISEEHASAVTGILLNRLEKNCDNCTDSIIESFGRIGPNASDAIPTLLQFRDDPIIDRTGRAALALYLIGHQPENQISFIIKHQDDLDAHLFCDLTWKIGPPASSAIPKLLQLSKDSSYRDRAFWAIERIDPSSRTIIQSHLEDLDDQDSNIRRRALHGLRPFLKSNPEVKKAINRALKDENPRVAYEAINLLEGPEPDKKEVFKYLLAYLNSTICPESSLFRTIKKEHGQDAAVQIIPALLNALECDNSSIAGYALETLKELGCDRQLIKDKLSSLLEHPSYDVPHFAEGALRMMEREEFQQSTNE